MVTAHSKHTQDAQFHTGASVHIRNVSGASLHKSPPQKWHHYSMQYFHVPATVLQSSWAGGNSSAPMPESREQVESSMGSCSCTVLGVAWHGLQPKNPGRKAKAQAQCHGTAQLSLEKRLGEKDLCFPGTGPVSGLMAYAPLQVWTAVFTSLCLTLLCRG